MKKKLVSFLKNETVLCAALLLAAISAVLVPPDAAYAGYLDLRTLSILFCLMAVMAGLQRLGIFRLIAESLLSHVRSRVFLVLILMLLCFVFSMFITNDVALITFIPLTFTVLQLLDSDTGNALCVPLVVMQTVAANLGSMLTPIGNPQNLYLYGKSGFSLLQFVQLMLPYSALSLALLLIWALRLGTRSFGDAKKQIPVLQKQQKTAFRPGMLLFYLLLFALCLLTVARVVPCKYTFAAVLLSVLFFDRRTLLQIDYALLATFAAFFLFIGNMGRIPVFRAFLAGILNGHEVLTAIASSQIISNVPAALLLSGFTDDVCGLIIGTNLGGLGTLIASMASLISYKYIAKEKTGQKGAYLGCFTAANFAFLFILCLFYFFLEGF